MRRVKKQILSDQIHFLLLIFSENPTCISYSAADVILTTLLITCVIHPIISIYAIAIFLFTRFNRHALNPNFTKSRQASQRSRRRKLFTEKKSFSASAMFCCQLDHVFRWVGVIKTSLFRITVLDRILGISIQMGEESLFLISVGYWCNIWLMISVMSKNKKNDRHTLYVHHHDHMHKPCSLWSCTAKWVDY